MKNGISLASVEPGELIFLNLPKRPGAGTDTVPPSAPSDVTERIGTNLGIQGMEISWKAAHDDNWISYYEILHDGRVIGRAATGTFFFAHPSVGGLAGRVDEPPVLIQSPYFRHHYSVRAVDGDGNRGPACDARRLPGDSPTYTAFGGYGPTQGWTSWTHRESLDGRQYRMMTWDNLGYEGLWRGSGRARIGRIWMEPGACSDVARDFFVPLQGSLSIEAPVRKDVSSNNGETVAVEVTLNGRRIWPESGPGRTDPDPDKELPCHLEHILVRQGDHIRFIAHRTGSNDPNPIIWAPELVIEPAAGMRSGTY
jgi:hypothetical protein